MISRRRTLDIALVGVACAVRPGMDPCAHIALASVGPTPFRLTEVEQRLTRGLAAGDAIEPLLAQVGKDAVEAALPITDVRATAGYRRRLVGVLTRRAVAECLAGEPVTRML